MELQLYVFPAVLCLEQFHMEEAAQCLIGYLVKLGIQIIFINFIYGEGEDLLFVKSFHFFILAAFHEISHCEEKIFDIMPDIGHGIQIFLQ